MTRKTGKEMADQLSDFMNSAMGFEKVEFVNAITSDHRYLQEEMFGAFFQCVAKWAIAYEKGHYDYRNVRACKLSYEIMDKMKEDHIL